MMVDEPRPPTMPADVLRAYRLLSDVNHALLRTTDEGALLDAVCRLIVETGGHRFAWVGVPEMADAQRIRPVAQFGEGAAYLHNARISWGDNHFGQGPTGQAVRRQQKVIAQDIGNSDYFWRDNALKFGFAAMIALPLRHNDAVFAVLVIYADAPQRFDSAEAALLGELADNLAFGITALRARQESLQTRATLEANERRFRALIEHSTDVFCLVNTDVAVEYISPSVEAVLGYPPDVLLGDAIFGIIHEPDVPRVRDELTTLLARTDATLTTNFCVRHADGTWRRLEVVGHNRLHEPSVGHAVILFRDITAYVRNQEELGEREE
jgi:PAS domain S-box-containing protein